MFGFSGGEILLIAFIALILFGNEKLPENMKKMLKGINQAKKVAGDVQRSWQDVKTDVQRSINFEDEKQQILELTKPVEVDFNINIADIPHASPPLSEIVSQDEIDDYQNSFENNNSLLCSSSESQDKVEEGISFLAYTPKSYLMSDKFVGPRI